MRYYIFEEAADRILQNAKNFVNIDVGVLLSGATGLANRDRLEGQKNPLDMVKAKRTQLAAVIDTHLASIKALARSGLASPLIEKQYDYARTAKGIFEKKQKKWNAASLRAFVNHEGCYKTPKVDKESWNEQFLESVVDDLLGDSGNNGQWKEFEESEKELFNKLQARLANKCAEIVTALKADLAEDTVQELQDFIDAEADRIRGICDHTGPPSSDLSETSSTKPPGRTTLLPMHTSMLP